MIYMIISTSGRIFSSFAVPDTGMGVTWGILCMPFKIFSKEIDRPGAVIISPARCLPVEDFSDVIDSIIIKKLLNRFFIAVIEYRLHNGVVAE